MFNGVGIRRRNQPISTMSNSRSATGHESVGLMLFNGLILVLFLTRFFNVAESADHGETLWIVIFWLIALLMWGIVSWKSAASIVPLGWLGVGVGLLTGGHVVSALFVVANSGDKRAAINLAWEWIGVATGWFLLRQQCRSVAFRRNLLAGLIATGTSIAALGLYQHYVEFPLMAANYGPMFDRLKVANPIEAAIIRKELAKENIPIEGPALTLFEKRLRDSREPLGLFALANTLGGVLSVCLILAVSISASLWQSSNHTKWWQLAIWVAILILLSWCLLLTKSRTAWIGTVVGLGLNCMLTRNVRLIGVSWRLVLGSIFILALAGWGLSRFGGLDKQVLTEAPKSLQYRLQYWSATVQLIRDHLLLGVGPGQFRWHYLFYKLPEASEEISDPHNLLLDVAANAGLAAVVGLLVILVFLVKQVSDLGGSDKLRESRDSCVELYFVAFFNGIVWVAFLFSGADDRFLILLPTVTMIYWIIHRTLREFRENSREIAMGWVSATFGLFAHLCGAGGIGMPAISMLSMALIAAVAGSRFDLVKSGGQFRFENAVIIGAISLGLIVGLFVTGVRPVAVVNEKLITGDQLVRKGMRDAADLEYRAAAAADSWCAEPSRRRAELAYRHAEAEQFRSNESFQTAVGLMRDAISRDPTSFRDEIRLGKWWIGRWQVTKDVKDAEEAAVEFERAWFRYPTNASLMAELAIARNSAGFGKSAKEIARKALRQDAINHERGHIDRYIPDQTRIQLESLCDSPPERK